MRSSNNLECASKDFSWPIFLGSRVLSLSNYDHAHPAPLPCHLIVAVPLPTTACLPACLLVSAGAVPGGGSEEGRRQVHQQTHEGGSHAPAGPVSRLREQAGGAAGTGETQEGGKLAAWYMPCWATHTHPMLLSASCTMGSTECFLGRGSEARALTTRVCVLLNACC